MSSSAALFVLRRGRDVTLRTFTKGPVDADYAEPTWTPTDKTVRAVRDVPKTGAVTRSASGDEVAVDAVFTLADVDAPVIAADVERPRVIDGEEFEVLLVDQAQLGARRLSCKKAK